MYYLISVESNKTLFVEETGVVQSGEVHPLIDLRKRRVPNLKKIAWLKEGQLLLTRN